MLTYLSRQLVPKSPPHVDCIVVVVPLAHLGNVAVAGIVGSIVVDGSIIQ